MFDFEALQFKNEEFPRGSIRKLIFHDFLTYNHVECIPGPYLNVVIGPNGTGKSTVICGICLASGGTPNLLGRSNKIGDFIRHGKMEGYVEMYLKDEREENGLRRFKIIIRKPNSAAYYINDEKVTHDVHLKAITEYNIQVENPCTFLAQDKVKSFAEQNSQLLLVNTEKAGNPELIELHAQLEGKYNEGSEMSERKAQLELQLKKVRIEIARVQPLARNYLDNEKRNRNIHVFKAKKAFLTYDLNEESYKEKQKETKDAHNVVKSFEARKAVIQKQINGYKNLQKGLNLERFTATINERRNMLTSKILHLQHAVDGDTLANAQREYSFIKNQCENWEKDLDIIKNLKAELVEKSKLLKANPPDRTELDEKDRQLTELKAEYELEVEANESISRDLLYKKHQIEGNKISMDQTLRKKIENLARLQKNDNLIKAWEYYTKNKSQFRHPVYVPYLCIYTEEKYKKYLNNLIGNKDIGIFIFGCNEDEKLLQRKFNVSSSVMTPEMTAQRSTSIEMDPELKKLGFIDYACNIFSAPEPVKAYFNSVNFFHNTPIGDETTDKNCEAVAHKIRESVKLFLTNKSRVNVVVSRYDQGKVTVNRTPLRLDGGFVTNDHTSKTRNVDENTDELIQKLQEVADCRKILDGKKAEFMSLGATVLELKNKLQNESDAIQVVETKLQKVERQEINHVELKPDLEQAKKSLEEIEKASEEQIPKEVAAIAKTFKDFQKDSNIYGLKSAESKRYQALIDLTAEDLEFIDLEAQEFIERYDKFKAEEDDLRKAFLNARNELKEVTGITTTDPSKLKKEEDKKIYDDLQMKFEESQVPETIEECDEKIRQEEIRAQVGNLRGSKEDVKKLETLEIEEQKVVSEVQKSGTVINNWEADMKTLLDQWLTPLKELVAKISENFVNFFGKIDCAGEVRLAEPEDNPLNIYEYGIDIHVKFRNSTRLHRLDGQQQSGGERSISTMLYLMALQELCPVPFRCVDEINQGMDPTNERIVFNMMVELLSADSGHLANTQYFMLTPKLLPGLKYTPKVSVLMVHNSSMMEYGVDVLNVRDKPYEMKVNF